MVSIQGFKRPLDGTGALFYYPAGPRDARYPPLVFRFLKRGGWASQQPAPFAWRLIEPTGDLRHPVLDLVADRFTEIVPPPAYDRAKGPDPSTSTPFVRVFRPQGVGRVPQEEAPFDPDRVLGNTDVVYGTRERAGRAAGPGRADPGLHQFSIHHLPLSNQGKLRGKPVCLITNVLGHYQLQLHVKNIWKPAAYWLQIFDHDKVVRGHTAVIWTYIDRNVEHKNILASSESVKLDVFRRLRAGANQRDVIPPFANNVATSQGGWPTKWNWLLAYEDLMRIRSERPEGWWWRQFVQRTEELIGVIPVVGDVYDIGSIAYMSVTGKAPWTGDRVPRGQAMIYAAAVLGPISVSQLRRFNTFARGLPRDLARLSDDALQSAIEKAIGPDYALSMAAAATDEGMRRLKLQLLAATGEGARKLPAKDFAASFSRLLADEADISTLEKRLEAMGKYTKVDRVFCSGVSTLCEPLETAYQAYLKRTKHSADAVTPLEWCRAQTQGKMAQVLATELGPNYIGKLRVLAGSGPEAVRRETFEAAVRALTGGGHVDNYLDLCGRTKRLYPVTERDHIFEKRFFLNNPDFSESMDIYEQSLAVLVPANHAMLDALRKLDPRVRVEYVHAEKRPLMLRLPDGREGEFPLQAVWDVHIDTYRQLGVKITPNGNSFGALAYQDLAANLDYLADDLRQQAAILRKRGQVERAEALLKKADYRKRFDPKDRAFRKERFEIKEWWTKADS